MTIAQLPSMIQSRIMAYFAKTTLRVIAAAALLMVVFAGHASAQPAGGKTSDTKPTTAAPKTPAKTPARTNSGAKSNTGKPPATTNASLNGKWWTSGNDFGASEVVFTQSGASVSGVIHYADGRTGTINGTMVGKKLVHTWTNSSGDGGSGWLELSWNNFLGGPWHNQRVRDGSWTLMRVEGKWCFGGSRDRLRTVTHNARGDVLSIAEDGTQTGGRLEGPWIYLESDGMTIKGDMDFRANRLNWSSGFFWSWCGRN
jgi:hypothetical protein